jgi:hypothetical protein
VTAAWWLGIDPGTEQSGVVVFLPATGRVEYADVRANRDVLERLRDGMWPRLFGPGGKVAIESIASYGMPVGREVFETCWWSGRFFEAADRNQLLTSCLYRRDVKLHLCGSVRAKDTHVRQALLDRFGPVGTKAKPGPLYGVTSHAWAALGVAVTADQLTRELA